MAEHTVAICDVGFHDTPSGMRVNIGVDLTQARAGTVVDSPEKPPGKFAGVLAALAFAVFDPSEHLPTCQARADRSEGL